MRVTLTNLFGGQTHRQRLGLILHRSMALSSPDLPTALRCGIPPGGLAWVRRLIGLGGLMGLLALQACGGGSGGGQGQTLRTELGATIPAGTLLIAGASCDLRYSVTSDPLLSGTDPELALQWHLESTGSNGALPGEDIRAPSAWLRTLGEGVRIGVIDDAIEVTHPDLYPNLAAGSISFRQGNSSLAPIPCDAANDDHGTAVAGIALARKDNRYGGSGVAPKAGLVAYDALATSLDVDLFEALTRANQRVHVYQNSWGSPDTGAVSDSGALFAQAIETGIAQGRGGLGSIFVFSGGNGGAFDNANLDGFVNRRGVIAVCGVDQRGQRMLFTDGGGTEPGANVLVCAPGINITTTALNGAMRSDFSGASAATPMVSGVAALMLAVNDALTWRDVPIILARTARKNDPNDPGWVRSSAEGSSLWTHPFYGFGVVNAGAAVDMARTWTSVGGSTQQRRCDSGERWVDSPIPDNTPSGIQAQITLNCPQITRIEFVEVEITTRHTYHGDLRIDLVSPQGGNSRLISERQCDTGTSDACGAYTGWRFGSVRHLDESANGVWTLTVSDRVAFDTGRLDKWRVIVHGR